MLAVNLGLSNLIQRWAGVFFAWEVWDEPGTFLSVDGVKDLLEVLAYRAETSGKSIWVVEHGDLAYEDFAEHWLVRKNKTGSTIEQLP